MQVNIASMLLITVEDLFGPDFMFLVTYMDPQNQTAMIKVILDMVIVTLLDDYREKHTDEQPDRSAKQSRHDDRAKGLPGNEAANRHDHSSDIDRTTYKSALSSPHCSGPNRDSAWHPWIIFGILNSV